MKKLLYLGGLLLMMNSCQNPMPQKISEKEVVEKLDEFFATLSVKNTDKNKIYSLVTDDYYIFENQQKYSMPEFLEFIATFNTVEDQWTLSNLDIDTDLNSAHVTLNNSGRFKVNTPEGLVQMDYEWLESAYLVKQDGILKFKFYFSEVVTSKTTPLE